MQKETSIEYKAIIVILMLTKDLKMINEVRKDKELEKRIEKIEQLAREMHNYIINKKLK